jgi:ATP-dependent DNA helicase RecQ
MMNTPIEILKGVFGYGSFRRGQEEIINEIMAGRDVLGIMPTGAGKSVCYQIPSIMAGGVSIVLSPLISLMKDQVDALRQNGVHAAAVNSSMDWGDALSVLRLAKQGKISMLYIAPERLGVEGFRDFLTSVRVSLVIVDEAHCVSQWGHDFRPSYLEIAPAVSSLPGRPTVAAFTATATPEVRDDIIKQLCLNSPFVLTTGFDRENLFFQVESPGDKAEYLMDYVSKFPDMSGIIYCSTRKTVENVHETLVSRGVKAVRYHAGLDDSERLKNQEDFIYDRASAMVATNAFGMGIDKSNVRYVIHYNMPGSIDNYYQEAGRAGRDGAPADCILLFGRQDIATARFLISKGEDEEAKKAAHRKLRGMIDYCHTGGCLRRHILNYFGETYEEETCGECGNCRSVTERRDITVEAQKILSCVYRAAEKTGGKAYGAAMLSDILRGRSTSGARREQIALLGLDSISTWGIMKEYTPGELMDMSDFLIAEGYLKTDAEFGTISFTDRSFPFLKSKPRLLMRRHEERSRRPAFKTAARGDKAPFGMFEALRKVRREIADAEKVPPYVVFSDKTLNAMCETAPSDEKSLLSIPGVGETKLEKYGARFLLAIREWKKNSL